MGENRTQTQEFETENGLKIYFFFSLFLNLKTCVWIFLS